jgi:uncharacterized surface protein with fasciclin (FAS1) repeats
MKQVRIFVALLAVSAIAGVATTPAGARPAAGDDIVATATGAGQFTTLTKLLAKAGLVATLQKPGPYTVFAPTDAAFAKVPKATLTALAGNRAKLRAVLLYHVVKGEVRAADVMKVRSAKAASGKTVAIRVRGRNVFVNDARVVKADVMASNGVIHVIDRVLLPPTD